jgi:hypothetical protein
MTALYRVRPRNQCHRSCTREIVRTLRKVPQHWRQDLCVVRPGMARLPASRSAAFDTLTAGAQFRDQIAIVAHATAPAIFLALFQVSLEDMPLAWWLGGIRYLPARLIGRAPDPPAPESRRPARRTRSLRPSWHRALRRLPCRDLLAGIESAGFLAPKRPEGTITQGVGL